MSIKLDTMEAAEVCAALKLYIHTTRAPASRRDALAVLCRIDKAMGGSGAPDDVLSAGEGTDS